MKNLNQHVKSDKVKWIITGIVLVFILAVLGGVVAMLFVERGGDDSTTSAAERTFCLNFTSIDEMVGYEYDDESDWFVYREDENTYFSASLVSVDMFSPTFDKDGMSELLSNTESVTVMLNGEEIEVPYYEVSEGTYVYRSADVALEMFFFFEQAVLSFGDIQDFPVVGFFVSGEGTLENFKIISFNLAEEPVPEYYTVTFDSNGGTSVDSQIIVPGGKVVKPENPVKSGVGFVEWQLDGEAYDFDTPVTSDITLVAYYL